MSPSRYVRSSARRGQDHPLRCAGRKVNQLGTASPSIGSGVLADGCLMARQAATTTPASLLCSPAIIEGTILPLSLLGWLAMRVKSTAGSPASRKKEASPGASRTALDHGGHGGTRRNAEDGRSRVVLRAPPCPPRSMRLLLLLPGQLAMRASRIAARPASRKGKQQHARNLRMHGGTRGSSAARSGIDPPFPILPLFPCILLSCRCQPPRGIIRAKGRCLPTAGNLEGHQEG